MLISVAAPSGEYWDKDKSTFKMFSLWLSLTLPERSTVLQIHESLYLISS